MEKLEELYKKHTNVELAKIFGVGTTKIKAMLKQAGLRKQVSKSLPPLTFSQESIITGSLLGDGMLEAGSTANSNYLFSKKQTVSRVEYLEWHAAQLAPYFKNIKLLKGQKRARQISGKVVDVDGEQPIYRFRTCSHTIFTEMESKWYKHFDKTRKKIIPSDLKLDPLSVAVWFCDDGHNHIIDRHAIFYTQAFTYAECQFLLICCKKI